ncbi:hypothetical protein SAMN06265349_104288 [Flavobacterium resistens]|uniref:Signal peptidase n=1 Tax=Flavobacterium resistens TaxID=443612 RepID=A0A521EA54_9FLAO|nr:hypothetical protein [Flavobacterium resistens]MRX69030.1 hypothetical protein [Flavobacterium resistens]SMO80804.1 hypothetical protein SAMN06265349_104288 [Flavobacterium resistens]
MKITKTIFIACCIVLLNVSNAFAYDDPPEPGPPAPPGVSIDQNLVILAGFAVLFGIYVIYKYNLIKKASI